MPPKIKGKLFQDDSGKWWADIRWCLGMLLLDAGNHELHESDSGREAFFYIYREQGGQRIADLLETL